MASDSAEVSIIMFAGHELVVPVHFRTSGLGDGYIRGHRCCSYCRFSLSCTARGLYLELLPAAFGACSRFHCAVPFCARSGTSHDRTSNRLHCCTVFDRKLLQPPGGASLRLICTLPSGCADTYMPCAPLSAILPPDASRDGNFPMYLHGRDSIPHARRAGRSGTCRGRSE